MPLSERNRNPKISDFMEGLEKVTMNAKHNPFIRTNDAHARIETPSISVPGVYTFV